MDELIIVDKNDNEIGYGEKDECHVHPARLHRAFSIFIFNSKGEMLIHKRSGSKKTWPGYWTNACCSHPRKGEGLEEATTRRLQEELGFTCPLTCLFSFYYKADYDSTYGEHEIDHVFAGKYDGDVRPDRNEVEEFAFVLTDALLEDVQRSPQKYTPWFKKALPKVLEHIAGK
ncbi:MAG TPA: isopentenyl-diphosphate Delta-isomerase [Syntrophorhabdaceae bacterium]|nr:isopentenyl-diphosphate Delta-isomerase [Syntrophorhabdaceae bacterium]HQM81590.1 isopentenyl-diphosphate Delta-isomerase [Syntrophorhabdaceae bacterium]